MLGETASGSLGSSSATRNVSNLRNKDGLKEMMAKGRAKLADQSGRTVVELDWELNEMAVRDKIFKITIGNESAYIDFEEWLFVQRVMFMKK